MKRVWKPLDVGGLRLYEVRVMFINHPQWNERHIVAGYSPTNAAERYKECVKGAIWEEEPHFSGHPLNILMPADWWESGAPDGYCEKCHRWTLRVVNNDLICISDDSHSLRLRKPSPLSSEGPTRTGE
jgi:hypothetical protein